MLLFLSLCVLNNQSIISSCIIVWNKFMRTVRSKRVMTFFLSERFVQIVLIPQGGFIVKVVGHGAHWIGHILQWSSWAPRVGRKKGITTVMLNVCNSIARQAVALHNIIQYVMSWVYRADSLSILRI